MNYSIKDKPKPAVKKGEFYFSAIGLDHVHIYDQCGGLIEAGGVLKSVYDPDPAKMDQFCIKFPEVKRAAREEEIVSDQKVLLVAGAAIPSERCALGLRVMSAGKDYFTDKAPLTSIDQLNAAMAKVKETGKKYIVFYGRLHNESSIFAGQLIEQGAIGNVIQVLGLGPHRLGAAGRPDWFFKKEKYGGIICDIGTHIVDQFLFYTKAKDVKVVRSQVANYNNPQYPEFEDFGDAMLAADNGSNCYLRVDWLTPDGLQGWGDSRVFILGTEGFIEKRSTLQLGEKNSSAGHVYLANNHEETYFNVDGKVGYPFFGQLILDCLNRTENAMTQEHAFKVAKICVKAQMQAVKLREYEDGRIF